MIFNEQKLRFEMTTEEWAKVCNLNKTVSPAGVQAIYGYPVILTNVIESKIKEGYLILDYVQTLLKQEENKKINEQINEWIKKNSVNNETFFDDKDTIYVKTFFTFSQLQELNKIREIWFVEGYNENGFQTRIIFKKGARIIFKKVE